MLRTLSGLQLTPGLDRVARLDERRAARRRPRPRRAARTTSVVAVRAHGARRVQPGSVALFARQLSTMISAGLPLVRALRSIARDHHDRKLAKVHPGQVGDDVQKGDSLATALARHPHVFDEVFVSLVQTGELSGTLDDVMDHTADYLERAEVLRLQGRGGAALPDVRPDASPCWSSWP